MSWFNRQLKNVTRFTEWNDFTRGAGTGTWDQATVATYYSYYAQAGRMIDWAFHIRAATAGGPTTSLTLTSPIAPRNIASGATISWRQSAFGYVNGVWTILYAYWDESNSVWVFGIPGGGNFNNATRQDVSTVLHFGVD